MDKAYPASALVRELQNYTDMRRAKILSAPTRVTDAEHNYYVSPVGDDASDGKTPQTAWATLGCLNSQDLPPASVVFFERGGVWRGQLLAKAGVSYSAYGSGAKPRLYASPENACGEDRWNESGVPGVYVYYRPVSPDVGTIVFDDGTCAVKRLEYTDAAGQTLDTVSHEPFSGAASLAHDLDFWHDPASGRLYLRSDEGDPGARFGRGELNIGRHVVRVLGDGVTLDNLCVRYGGDHGVSAGSVSDLTVTNCEFGWIGGSIQKPGIPGKSAPVRYGNAVEIWGGCRGYNVANCWAHDIYDAALTVQYIVEGTAVTMEDVAFRRNVIENCNYGVEYFLSDRRGTASCIRDFCIEDNLMWNAGQGLCEQRPDPGAAAHIKSWSTTNRASGIVVRNNLFALSRDLLVHLCADSAASLPRVQGNTYIQRRSARLAACGVNPGRELVCAAASKAGIAEAIGDRAAKFYAI